MPTYRVEEAKSGRAGCQNSECKHNDVKILKGELRFGNLITLPSGDSSFKWKHWGCVTPFQLVQWKEASEGDMDLVDGYEELPPDVQDKVKRAIMQGHVDDADWKGDVEANRDGKKGFRLSRPNTPKKAPGDMANQEEDEDETGASPTKAAPKSRRRAVKAEVDDKQTEAVKLKKARGHAVKAENTDNDDEDAPPKKSTGRAKKAKAANDETETNSRKKASAPNKKADKGDTAPGAGPPKRTSGRTQKSKKYTEDEDEETGSGDEQPPMKKARASKKKATAKDDGDSEEASAPIMSKSGRKKKAADGDGAAKPAAKGRATKNKSKEIIEDDDSQADD